MTILSAVWRTSRPMQWTKTLPVVAAPLGAGDLLDPDVSRSTLLASAEIRRKTPVWLARVMGPIMSAPTQGPPPPFCKLPL